MFAIVMMFDKIRPIPDAVGRMYTKNENTGLEIHNINKTTS